MSGYTSITQIMTKGVPLIMHKTVIISFLLVLMVGCATTTTELSEGTPDFEFFSGKSTRNFAACVSSQWGKEYAYVTTNLLENGFTVALMHWSAGADAVATITESSDGSRVSYAERIPSLSPSWMKEAVIGCK